MRARRAKGSGFDDRGGDNVYRPGQGQGQGDIYLTHDANQQRMAETIQTTAERLLGLESIIDELKRRICVDTVARALVASVIARVDLIEDALNTPSTGLDARLDALEGWRVSTVDPAVSALSTLQSAVTTFKGVYNSHSHTYSYSWEGTGTTNQTSIGNPTGGPSATA